MTCWKHVNLNMTPRAGVRILCALMRRCRRVRRVQACAGVRPCDVCVARVSLWCACRETLETRLPCVFHGLNGQVFLDSCRLFWACIMPCVPRGTRSAGVLHMLTCWMLHGSKLATCAELAALVPSAFHRFSTIKFYLKVATWCIFCQIWHADGVQKCRFWNYSCFFACPPALEPCGLRDFFQIFAFFS